MNYPPSVDGVATTLCYANITNWKDPPFSMGKSTISMAIFNSKLLIYQRVTLSFIADFPASRV